MASILKLAPELMQQILDHAEPASHLNLALACKGLRDRLDFILRHHQLCHAHYRTASDIHPSTIPRLLRSILINGDWVAAWHFRSIEIWGSRSTWEDWKESFELVGPAEGGRTVPPDPDAGTSYGPDFFTERELDCFQKFIVKDLGLGVEGVSWLDHIKSGRDDVLKVLLIAVCSRLRAVRFIRGSSMDLDTLSKLGVAIKAASKSGPQSTSGHWPPGFASVEEFVVGVSSRALLDAVPLVVHTNMEHVAQLFALPALRSLYIHGFSDDSYDMEDAPETRDADPNDYWGLPVASSPIQNLCFDTPETPGYNPTKALIRSCGRLRHLTFQNGDMHGGNVYCDQVNEWASISKLTLKSVLWCNISTQGYRSDMFYPEENNESHIMTVSANDFLLCGLQFNDDKPDIEKAFIEYMRESLGGAGRVITNYRGRDWQCSESLWERALIAVCRELCWGECEEEEEYDEDADVEDKSQEDGEKLPCGCPQDQHINYPYFPERAPALYLEDVDPWNVPEGAYPWTNLRIHGVPTEKEVGLLDPMRRPYAELISLCKQWGVEIYTRTIKAPRVHNVDLPTLASEKDIETSPWFKHPDVERIYFKPHKGMVDDCGNCGACEDCYRLYPAELWAAWKEGDEKLEAEKRARDAEENDGDGDEGDGDGEEEEEEEEEEEGDEGEDGLDDEQDGEEGEDDGDDDKMRDVQE